MNFTVIGSDAIGGTVGAHLSRSGHEIRFCDADPMHVAAIRADGLQITSPVGEFTVRAPAPTPDQLPAVLESVVLVAVKSHHTHSAAQMLRDRLAAAAVSMQNGLTADVLFEAVDQ